MNSILSQLYDHQTAVKAAMAESRVMLGAETVDPQETATARWAMTRLLTGYQMFKHQRIFDPLSRHGVPAEAQAARSMKIECVAMAETFRAHLARWTASGIEGHEIEYRRDATGMMALLERHILRERRGIEALLGAQMLAA